MGEYAGSVLWGEGKHFVTYNGTISRPKDISISSKFGYYMLLQKNINKVCGGSGLPFLSYEQLNKIDIDYPSKEIEQLKISQLLTNIDNLITLHQRKSYVKIYDWEQRKLGEIISSYSGGTPNVATSSFYGGNIPFIRSGEIKESTTELSLTKEGLENSSAKMVKKGDILYALYGATSGEVSISLINGRLIKLFWL